MGLQTDHENNLREFLLGALPAAEREAIEDRFMVEAGLFAALNRVEEDLLEEYARGELSAPEREQVEKHLLLSTRNQERVRLLRTMHAAFENARPTCEPEPQTIFGRFFGQPFWRYALPLASCLILVLGLGWWWLRGRERDSLQAGQGARPDLSVPREKPQPVSPNPEPTLNVLPPAPNADGSNNKRRTQAPPETPSGGDPAPPPRRATPQPFIATLTLSTVATRSEGRVPELRLPAAAQAARLKLTLETNDHARYRAVLTDEDGAAVWTSGTLKAVGQIVTLEVPARYLREGDYFLKLLDPGANTSAPAAEYSFRVRTH